MHIVDYSSKFLLGVMSGITILGLSSSELLGLTGAACTFLALLLFGGFNLKGPRFHRRL